MFSSNKVSNVVENAIKSNNISSDTNSQVNVLRTEVYSLENELNTLKTKMNNLCTLLNNAN